MYKKSLFIFRRSFRLEDNTGLIEALKQSKVVIPIFIFTPEQIVKNRYKSDNAVQFMIESLKELDTLLRAKGSKLFYFFGRQDEVVARLIKDSGVDAVFGNADYTPYARRRDKKIAALCKKAGVSFHAYEDFLLHPVASFVTGGGKPYQKYTPYLRKASRVSVAVPVKNRHKNYASSRISVVGCYKGSLDKFYKKNESCSVVGGRKAGQSALRRVKRLIGYDKQRNDLSYATSRLSAHIKFGTVSIREVYAVVELSRSKDLVRQLYWRDFYYQIAHHFPGVFKGPLKEKYGKVSWKTRARLFEKWKKGETGFPLVDAAMRELNVTGFMHNRGRLVVSNFLIKLLQVDWRKGELYFATKLVDYDPAVNNGNWQWSASCGADSQPYFRIFNPWTQSKKFDPDAAYIKKWVPELKDVPAKDIHRWDDKHSLYVGVDYPKPCVRYEKARQAGLNMFKKV